MKLSRHDIQKLEDYWINLDQYKRDLKFREWELLNQHQQSVMVDGRSNTISDILAEDELYQNLKRIIVGIELI